MLINCVAYQNGAKLAEPSIEDINEYLKRPDCLVWVELLAILVIILPLGLAYFIISLRSRNQRGGKCNNCNLKLP
jgi:hypothetical protein